jgi:hypothetical protein
MAVFSDRRIGANHLLGVIPESLLANLSAITKVDHYSKVLHGNKMFYLLMYGILENGYYLLGAKFWSDAL